MDPTVRWSQPGIITDKIGRRADRQNSKQEEQERIIYRPRITTQRLSLAHARQARAEANATLHVFCIKAPLKSGTTLPHLFFLSPPPLHHGTTLLPSPPPPPKMPVHVSSHPCLQAKLSQLRSQSTSTRETRGLVTEVSTILGVEALAELSAVPGAKVRDIYLGG